MSEMSLLHTRDHCDIQTGMLEVLCQNFVVTIKTSLWSLGTKHLASFSWAARLGFSLNAKRRSLSFLSFSLASFY